MVMLLYNIDKMKNTSNDVTITMNTRFAIYGELKDLILKFNGNHENKFYHVMEYKN